MKVEGEATPKEHQECIHVPGLRPGNHRQIVPQQKHSGSQQIETAHQQKIQNSAVDERAERAWSRGLDQGGWMLTALAGEAGHSHQRDVDLPGSGHWTAVHGNPREELTTKHIEEEDKGHRERGHQTTEHMEK